MIEVAHYCLNTKYFRIIDSEVDVFLQHHSTSEEKFFADRPPQNIKDCWMHSITILQLNVHSESYCKYIAFYLEKL